MADRRRGNAASKLDVNPIILHVGSTKTGTTSLQRYLARHAQDLCGQGVVYPQAGRRGGDGIAHHNLCYEAQPRRVRAGVFRVENGGWGEALAEIDSVRDAVGVLSTEAFMNAQPSNVDTLREILHGREVRILAYVRRQDRWLQSAWNQQARFGRTGLDFQAFVDDVTSSRGRGDYHRAMVPWQRNFGHPSIHVHNFDQLPADGIVPDFMGTFFPTVPVTVPAVSASRRNTKAGVKQLVAMSVVARMCRERVGPEATVPTSTAVRLSDYFRDRPGEVKNFSVLTRRDAKRLLRRFRRSNRRLRAMSEHFRASGGFDSPHRGEYDDYMDLRSLDETVFDEEERRYVIRMGREVSKVLNQANDPEHANGSRSAGAKEKEAAADPDSGDLVGEGPSRVHDVKPG